MTSEDTIRALAQKLAGVLPQNMRTAGGDIERNFRSVLDSGLAKMNLVSREEFDVQAAVLERTQEKLAELEETLAALEAHFDDT
ncbi:MAG: accessory factor UbiK family protein [Pseudomonadota bacterium]